MPLRCQLVVADLVGTTLEDNGEVEGALETALKRFGLLWQPEEFALRRGRTKIEAISAMLAAQGRAPEEAGPIHAAFIELLRGEYQRQPLRWVAGAEQAFRTLAAAGVRLVLATGFPAEIRDALEERVPWRDCLTAFLSGDDAPHGRPAPDLVLAAMRRAGVSDPGQVAVVGDTPADIASGRAAGAALVIAVTNGARPRAVLEASRPDLLLASVADLAPALLDDRF